MLSFYRGLTRVSAPLLRICFNGDFAPEKRILNASPSGWEFPDNRGPMGWWCGCMARVSENSTPPFP